ncbi:MAG: homoserine O-succinyltransferase [Candidatus Thioglobus sp.]|nr:homoserine O-succinyltransferase [Candidatus Thioglobus sp.]
MPLIAHSNLPSFERLKKEGETILSKDRAAHQSIRELHIGLLNIMPDAALEATERQFFRLIGHSNQIAQFYLHPFTLPSIVRSENSQSYVDQYYQSFEDIKSQGLDALIITGAHVEDPDLKKAPFYSELKEVIEWAYNHTTSTLCSCLATHAVLEFRYGQKRQAIGNKCWGVFKHNVLDRQQPLMSGVNTCFDVPHSRYNEISKAQFNAAGIKTLVESSVGAHLCVSEDLFRIVFFQGHPEYDTVSLLKEYKREIILFLNKARDEYPVFPEHYLSGQNKAILNEFKAKLLNDEFSIADFPETLITQTLGNTWHDATSAIINNWIGCVYQVTHEDINKPFMDGVDPNDPLGLK